MSKISVAIKPLSDMPLPAYATVGSAGMDLYAAIKAQVILAPNDRVIVPCGFAMALPQGYEAQIRPRSGLAIKHGITVLNSPGTIDSDYRGEVGVILINLGKEPFTISSEDRIAQMVIAPYAQVDWQQSDTLPKTMRESGGYGSTGLS